MASVKPRSVTVFNYYPEAIRHKAASVPPLACPRDHGIVASRRSQMKMRTALDLLIYTAKWKTVFVTSTQTYFRYKINFITLTLPSQQQHSDKEIVAHIFSKFMEAWARRRPGLLYVYKCEVQDNGNIHFHVISNAFYHYAKLRRDWNRYCNKLGYVDRSSTDDPNSTDVHALSNKGDIAAYLSSYMSKKDIYKKPLKRYFARFGASIRKSSAEVFNLPKNYFNNIKRKINTNTWNASRVLKGFKAVFEYNISQVSWRMLAQIRDLGGFRKFDYCEQMYYEANCFSEFPEFKKAIDLQLQPVFSAQKSAVIDEKIKDL